MKLLLLWITGWALALAPVGPVQAATVAAPALYISQVKVKNDSAPGGFNEYVQLFNSDLTAIDLSRFRLEYFNVARPATNSTATKSMPLGPGQLAAGDSVVLASNPSQIADSLDLAISLPDNGGLIRLAYGTQTIDELAWTADSRQAVAPVLYLSSSTTNKSRSFTRQLKDDGTPLSGSGAWQLAAAAPISSVLLPAPVLAPPAGGAGGNKTGSDKPLPPDKNDSADNNGPTPGSETAPPAETPPADPNGETTPPVSATPVISELLPNPAPPASDANDEFVELFNPNAIPVNLNGYQLETGTTFNHKFTFSSGQLQPGEYKAFYVKDTGALLANSGGAARLLAPDGRIVSQTTAYQAAPDGQAWALIDSDWRWTTTPTASAANRLTLPEPPPQSPAAPRPQSASAKQKTVKSAPVVKAATAKTQAKKAVASKTPSARNSAPKTDKTKPVSDRQAGPPPKIQTAVVAGVGALALGYGLWEYRYDLENGIHRFRGYRARRRALRSKT